VPIIVPAPLWLPFCLVRHDATWLGRPVPAPLRSRFCLCAGAWRNMAGGMAQHGWGASCHSLRSPFCSSPGSERGGRSSDAAGGRLSLRCPATTDPRGPAADGLRCGDTPAGGDLEPEHARGRGPRCLSSCPERSEEGHERVPGRAPRARAGLQVPSGGRSAPTPGNELPPPQPTANGATAARGRSGRRAPVRVSFASDRRGR